LSRFVIDASVVLSWCFPDEHSPVADRVALMFKQGDTAIAPAFWPHEVLNGLLVGEKRKRISTALIDGFLGDLSVLPVDLCHVATADVFGRIQELSRQHELTAYDAAYFHLAEEGRLKLATLDDNLIDACRRSGVDLI
jgi:predicted nucleic acid-binding protein